MLARGVRPAGPSRPVALSIVHRPQVVNVARPARRGYADKSTEAVPPVISVYKYDSAHPDYAWRMKTRQWTVKVTDRPQDQATPDDTDVVGNWNLDAHGEHKWKHAEERRRFFI